MRLGRRDCDHRPVLKVLYWVAVLAVSLALVAGLILFLESRDSSSLDSGAAPPALLA